MNMPLEWATVVLSWPVVLIFCLSLFRRPFSAFLNAATEWRIKRVHVAGLSLEIDTLRRDGEIAIDRFNQLSLLMAETNAIRWEIEKAIGGRHLPPDQVDRMQKKLDEMQSLVEGIRKGAAERPSGSHKKQATPSSTN
ncbi:hypothetical protein [Paraburkholderia sp. HP33-1]|uniref:hypothetical protein n=1 Tax=Paraburkholderia sp. HP33-1 TaxID=2883243 RepID=UPI001F3011E4|nr:hypothetical protein [Paraburkholderia sp. HP33-1]